MSLSRIALAFALALGVAIPALAEGDQAPPVLPPEETFLRTAHAARRQGPIHLDGKLDDAAWAAVPWNESFTQARPDEGKPATVHTRFKVLWDDDAFYLGVECDDPELPTATLSRRDRFTEGDYISFDLDTTQDRRTAYHFQVYAAGQQLDAIHFNDTDMTTDWDAAWESAVSHSPQGWSAELKIPLRVLRIPEHARAFGFNLYRVLSRRHEEDQWRFRPYGRPGDISRLGTLDGLDGIHPVREIELRPYVGGRLLRNSPAPSNAVPRGVLGSCSSIGLDSMSQASTCVGLDLRYNLASDLSLVGTLNPDFGQVEADSRVLNLSTFETFFPEKRPFFLEQLDLFKSPLSIDFGGPYGGDAYQIFYSRRIGRSTPGGGDLNLAGNQALVYQASAVPVFGAAKISGTLSGASVGLLSAIEPRVSAQVQEPDGRIDEVRTVEARSTSALRVRAPIGDNALIGLTGTAVDPIATETNFGLDRRHAHVGGADFTVFNQDRSWNFTGQALGSLLTGNSPSTLLDGTHVGMTQSGYGASARLAHETEHTAFAINGDLLSPTFTVNDLGFMQRANLARVMGYFVVRDPHANSWRQRIQLIMGGREIRNAALDYTIERDVLAELTFTTNNFWFVDFGTIGQLPYADDRELHDGTPLERQKSLSFYGYAATDSRKPLRLEFSFTQARSAPRFERQNQLETTLTFRPLPQLEGSFDLSYNENAGTFRRIRAASDLPGLGCGVSPNPPTASCPDVTSTLDPAIAVQQTRLYLLAQQHARSVSATLRSTYAFTPYLTLQAYAQLFAAGVSYSNPSRALAGPGKSLVRLADLTPALNADLPPNANDRQAGANLQVILRWEWRTGSTFYLVYAHQTASDVTPLSHGLSLSGELGALGGSGVANGDTILIKVDLLKAL